MPGLLRFPLLALVLVLLALGGGLAGASGAAVDTEAARASSAEPPVVASLEPAKTAELWSRLVATRARQSRGTAECRPLRAVFYAATDWLRLATKLRERQSPCAEYYISIPAIVGNRTRLRPDAAWRIRALGPNFHAMAEISFAAWAEWVRSTGSSWHAAGVTARQRMAEAGYDVALGDTWAVNELNSAVRRGAGEARANIRELLRGLYEGDGSRPTQGAALVVGIGQRLGDVSVYQNTLQAWLSDTAFWTDMSTYVSDWTQEVYGDVRSHAVPGTSVSARREYLNDYLQHKRVLSSVAPADAEPARTYLREAYSPLANAAWQRDKGYGWTMVPAEQMAAYVSAQVNALRYHSATAGQARDHWGFAWAPRNATGMPDAEFGPQTNLVLERMAAAIRDSGEVVDPESPGSGACGPPGQETFCLVDLTDARHNDAWRSFRGWTQAALGFATREQSIEAGRPSAAIRVGLFTSTGLRITSGPPRVVTLRSGSPQGTFATSPAGPWAPTLTLTAAVGADAVFHYRDLLAGRQTITASAAGTTTGTQAISVTAGPAAALVVTPSAGEVPALGTRRLSATVTDAYGNVAPADAVTWSVRPAALGSITPGDAGTATFTAGRRLGSAAITAGSGAVSATASVTVVPGTLRVGPILYRPGKRGLRVLLSTTDAARRPVSATRLTLVVRRDDRRALSARVRTGAAGNALLRIPGAGRGCFTVAVTRALAQGFVWDGRTPRNRFCRR